ncbi:anhydro-N-acetylmuramic acid kinase [Plastorhodobacter daqingensis]|uniref:Anhydro-N-acetylmuramic acid kinase n=1 Tax=Plastorhodobacter daqingensis TaxID=1387281 RepID=A0ABW2UJ98_9RHOB
MNAIWALGTMSGTSLDGVDAAFLRTDGESISAFGETAYRAYAEPEREVIRRAFGLWPGDDGVAEAAALVEAAHVAVLGPLASGADLVGFHGQTLAHDPGGRGTHQAGDGAEVARRLGLPVAWDFRSADVAAGGQGAPLAPFFHHACARWARLGQPVAFLNLGGVGNVTWVDPAAPRPEDPGALVAFDTGPANAPLNDLLLARHGMAQDEGGLLALSGQADAEVVRAFLCNDWLLRSPPKSLDRHFPDLLAAVEGLSVADAAATLVAAATACVAASFAHMPARPALLLVCGGGRHNRALMEGLAAAAPCPVAPVESIGLNGDMLEAQAFAYLAVRVQRGLPLSAPMTTGVPRPLPGGRISLP